MKNNNNAQDMIRCLKECAVKIFELMEIFCVTSNVVFENYKESFPFAKEYKNL